MALEYRKFYMVLDQTSPEGSLGEGTSDGGIIWVGTLGTFPTSTYQSTQMSVQEVAIHYITKAQAQTFNLIEEKMPQWRLNRWRRYYDLSNKVKANISLNTVEQAEYNCFPDIGETHVQCDVYVGPVLQWCTSVIVVYNVLRDNMLKATTVESVLSLYNNITFPAFPTI